MRKNTIKAVRINAEVMRCISEVIAREVKDPRVSPFTNVTAVEVTRDLKYAKVYISVLGDEAAFASTLEGLKSSAGFIRGRLAAEVNLRVTPELKFVGDQSIAYGVKMSHLIDEVIASDEEHIRARGEEETDQEEDPEETE